MRRSLISTLAFSLVTSLSAWAQPHEAARHPAVDTAYQQSFDKWKAEMVDDLKQNWLPLAGLFWLKPGENSFGTDLANAIVLPKGPAHAGAFKLQTDQVTVQFEPRAQAKIAGKAVTSAKLDADISGHATVIELGSLRMHVIVRGKRVGIRVKDLDSAAVRNYPGPVFYPIDLHYRVIATWIPSDGKKMVDVPNVLGDVTPISIAGVAHFMIDGHDMELTPLNGDPAKGFFFVFRDPTSKRDTYPGGRFLDTEPVDNGKLVLDFNRAYNPPCAVTPYATCPLAPKENRLNTAIPAGQKYERPHGSHSGK